MAGVSCVLSEDQLLCSICLEVFTDPVTTSCGHSFCKICINKHWDNSNGCLCPVCKEDFSSRPKLKTNICLSEMVSEFKNKPQTDDRETSESGAAGAGDVVCDVCPEPKLKALKSCLVCQTSYCPEHLTPHSTVPRLKKHQLIAPVQNLEERLCPGHEQPMELFCRDHAQLICVLCSFLDHKNHSTVPVKKQCEEEQKNVEQKIQERRKKIQELQMSVELSQKNADREMKEGEEFFNDLMRCVQESLDQFKQNIKDKHQEIKEKTEELLKKLESEISALEQRRAQMEEIFSSEDHFHFVQTFTSVQPAPELKDWTEVSVRAPSYEGRVATAVFELQDSKLQPKIQKLFEDELKQAKKHAVNVTLDRTTGHPKLYVSKEYKLVRFADETQNVRQNRRRFSNWYYVCGRQKFSTGKFYFEVQVKGNTNWCLGMISESADRKAETENMTEENGFWEISGDVINEQPWSGPEKVGVFVDYEEGLICFFDACSSRLIHCFSGYSFTESLLPLLSPGDVDDEDSAPLLLTPVYVASDDDTDDDTDDY